MNVSHDRPSSRFALSLPVPEWSALVLAGLLFLVLAATTAVVEPWRQDEYFTYDITNMGWGEIVLRTSQDVHPPLFYLIMKAWRTLIPSPERMRIISILVALGGVGAGYAVARLAFGKRAAALAGLLLASFPQYVNYGVEVRMYPYANLFELTAMAGWLLRSQKRKTGWALFVICGAASLYTHNFCAFFLAALIGCDSVRLLARWFRLDGENKELNESAKRDLIWNVTASVAVNILFAVWLPTIFRQAGNPAAARGISAPTLASIARELFFYPYTITTYDSARWLGWIVCIMMLGMLPILLICIPRIVFGVASTSKVKSGDMDHVRWIIPLCGFVPIIVLLFIGKFVITVFDLMRHGLLFTPFLVISSAAVIAKWSERSKWSQIINLASVILSSSLAMFAAKIPDNPDYTEARNLLIERSPLGSLVVGYPYFHTFAGARLIWQPLPQWQPKSHDDFPDNLDTCTLVVASGGASNRDQILDRVRLCLDEVREVRSLFETYTVSAYYLQGIPKGALRRLFAEVGGSQQSLMQRQIGDAPTDRVWEHAELSKLCNPQAEPIQYDSGYLGAKKFGARLRASSTEVTLPLDTKKEGTGIRAIAMGCQIISKNAGDYVDATFENGSSFSWLGGRPAFIVRGLMPNESPAAHIRFEMSRTLAQSETVPKGDFPRGCYLVWGASFPLDRGQLKFGGYDGDYYNIGNLGDLFFIRSGFHTREGMPPNDVRWTEDRFALELPVWVERAREVTLFGMLAEAIKKREVKVQAISTANGATKVQATGSRLISEIGYGEFMISLAPELPSGIYRLEFELEDAWIPQEHGQGKDPRRLGFYLNGVGLR